MMDTETDPEIVERFRARRKWQLVAAIPLIVLMLGAFYLAEFPDRAPAALTPNRVFPVLFAVIAVALVVSRFNWRCPACGKYLGKAMNPKFCAKCGARMQ